MRGCMLTGPRRSPFPRLLWSVFLLLSLFGGVYETLYCRADTPLIKVAVIDTGLNLADPRFSTALCQGGHKDFTGTGLRDKVGHGTFVAGLIKNAAYDHSKYCLLILKVTDTKAGMVPISEAIVYATQQGAKIINISMTGKKADPDEKAVMEKSGALFSIAAGNEDKDYHTSFPGGYGLKNVTVVGNWDCKRKKKNPNSNYGTDITWRCGTEVTSTGIKGTSKGSGTSFAAPLYTAELINQMTKGND